MIVLGERSIPALRRLGGLGLSVRAREPRAASDPFGDPLPFEELLRGG